MKQTQDNTITMFETTLAFLDKKNNIWKNRSALVDAITRAKEGTAQIRTRSGKQQSPTEGVTEDKTLLRDDLEEKLLVIGDAIAAFAQKTADADLAAKVEMNKSSLDGLKESDLVLAAKRVTDAAEANLAALDGYGVNATNNDELKAAADLFANKKESPRQAIVGRRVETMSLPAAIRFVRSIFRKEIDKLMSAFKKPEPDFYKGYFVARIIVDRGATNPPKEGEEPAPPAEP